MSIARDVSLWASLPDESKSKRELLADIDRRVSQSIRDSQQNRRDLSGVALAATLLLGAAAGGYWITTTDGAWRLILWLPVVFLALLGIVGMSRSLPSVERDERGRPVEK